MTKATPVIEVENLVVEYATGKRRHRAVDGISFTVQPGETIGFIGANGAGKSTTIKTMMGFLFPTSGSVQLFGQTAGTVESRSRVGYLPEVALYYPFMKARELLQLYGGLHGLSRRELKKHIPSVLERVGLEGKGEILLRNFSKGMQQRLGIAQAIIAEPEALIFDELSSGLDPLGRHDLRDVLLELKAKGRTIFFSSHELTEVEALCDRVVMIHQGRIVAQAGVNELIKPLNQFGITFKMPKDTVLPPSLEDEDVSKEGEAFEVTLHDAEKYPRVLSDLTDAGATIIQTASKVKSLEEFFIELVREKKAESLQA